MEKTAVIIGAGPAGLTAAYKLLKETDIKPVIYEQSDMIGGISRTVPYNGNRIDIGGHRFFSKNGEVNALWKELMPIQAENSIDDIILGREKQLPITGPDPETQDVVMLLRNRVSRIFYNRRFFDYPISMKPQTFINMGFVDTVRAGFGYLFSLIFKRKENSLEDFYINRFGKPLYSMFFEGYTEKLWGVHPSKISPEWGAQRVKGISLIKIIGEMFKKLFNIRSKKVETSLIEEFSYPKKGPGQLYEIMAEKIVEMGGTIHMNSSVEKINTTKGEISSIAIKNSDGKLSTVKGDYYLSTMPVKDLVVGMNDVPNDVKEIAENLPYRDFITVGLLMKKLLLKNKTPIKTVNNIVPDCWIYIQERDVKVGRLQVFNNWSPYMVKDFENTVWVGMEYFCNEGDDFWNSPDKEFIDFAIDELAKIDIIDKADVLDSVRINIKKAYPAYFGTYEKFDSVKDYLNGFENLYCLGRNGQHRYNNMDHSMLTSFVAVDLIKKGSTNKTELWNVNSEEEYHEEKSEN